MKLISFLLLLVAPLGAAMTPDEGLERLKEGNRRFVKEKQLQRQTTETRVALSEAQAPYAVIVTCSDSRVIPEVIFDEGLGDLFVIRVAGNIVDATELESVEYAVAYLNPVVVVVMGHEGCGAVDAVVQGKAQDISTIAAFIEPAVKEAHRQKGDLLTRSIQLNAQNMGRLLSESPTLKRHIEGKQIIVQAAYYNMETGRVEFL